MGGAFTTRTEPYTGRLPNAKFIVREASSERHVHWSSANRPPDETQFEALHQDMMRYLGGDDLFVIDAWAGALPQYRPADPSRERTRVVRFVRAEHVHYR